MAGDEGKHLLLFPGLMHRQCSFAGAGHAYSLPGFPPQVHLPLPGVYPPTPGAYTYARPGGAYAYAYAHEHAYAYPPPSGPYAYPPQGYPQPQPGGYPGSFSPQHDHGSRSHGSGRHVEIVEKLPKAGMGKEPLPKAGGGMEKEPLPKAEGGATASATAYGATNNLFRGHGSRNNNGAFGCFGSFCGQHGSMFKHASHGHQQGQFKQHGRRPVKVEHVQGKFCAKRTTWKE